MIGECIEEVHTTSSLVCNREIGIVTIFVRKLNLGHLTINHVLYHHLDKLK